MRRFALLAILTACSSASDAPDSPRLGATHVVASRPARVRLSPVWLDAVLGRQPATLGPAFVPKAGGHTPFAVEYKNAPDSPLGKSSTDVGDDPDQGSVVIQLDSAVALRDAAVARWGAPPIAPATWLDPAHHVAATIDETSDATTMRWAYYQTADELVKPADPVRLGIEPVALIGARTSAFERALGDHFHSAITSDVSWWTPGLPGATESIEIVAGFEHDKISDFTVWFEGPRVELDKVMAALRTKYGAPIDPKLTVWTTGGRHIRANDDGAKIELEVEPASSGG
jgi:hypothetical protein